MPTVTATASATTPTTCACCGTLSAATLECRIRGGTASLCGYEEYTDPSTPPKKYRIRTLSGSIGGNGYAASDCSGSPVGGSVDSFSGTCSYNSSNCVLTEAGTRTRSVSGDPSCSGSASSTPTCTIGGLFANVNDYLILTPTTRAIGNDLECGTSVGGGPCPYPKREVTPTAQETLSDEDTNEDAIARLLAGAGGTWGDWLSPGATGCTGVPPPCCLARWEERTSDFDFVYQEAQYRVTASGLAASTTYNARVEIYRSVFGASSYSLFQTLIISGTTDGSGNFSEDGDVPNEEGFESYAHAAYIVIPS